MEPGAHGSSQLYGLVLTLLIAVVVLGLRNRRPRRLRLEAMWIRPLIFFALIGLTFTTKSTPLGLASLLVMIVALAVGVAAGWVRGSLMRIDVHPETHDITARASPVGMLFILAVLGVREFIRNSATSSVAGLPAAAIADALILFAAAMMITQGLEMFLRARRLLGEARSASVDPANRPIVS